MKLILSMKVAFFCAFAVIAAGLCPAAEELLTSPDAGKTIRVFLDEGNVLRVPHGITPDRTRLGIEPDAKIFSMRIRRKQRGIEPAGE